jgi:hypothetical protein
MTMVGDMFNHSKSRVDAVCSDLARLLMDHPESSAEASVVRGLSATWWSDALGVPGSSGGQNEKRYAYFPEARRLAVNDHGQVSIYDTLDHQIGGVSQQQSSSTSLTFTSQHGPVGCGI